MAENIHDLVIVGGGPSALSAAIYATRDGFDTVICEKSVIGGIAATIDHIENYPGFPDGISGYDYSVQLQQQAEKFGAKIEFGEVKTISKCGDNLIVKTDDTEIEARAVLIASGCSHSKLNIPGEAELYGRGVSYCATCDGAFYIGKRLAVVGGANSAIQEALYLTQFATHIDLLVRSTVKASDVLQKRLQKFVDEGKITVHLGTIPREIKGKDSKVCGVVMTEGGTDQTIDVDGVFVFVGLKPNVDFLTGSGIELDDAGFIKSNHGYQTNLAGAFACGDVRSGSTRQIVSAAGEGASSAIAIREYLKGLKG